MNKFTVLNAANPIQYKRWRELWMSSWSSREVFAHPDYTILLSRECDDKHCAVMECANGLILLPIILRPLGVEIWAVGDPYYDVVTPYGFGGPYVNGDCDMAVFWRRFDQWCKENGVVSAFFRLPPFIADLQTFTGSIEVAGENVIRSLTEGKEYIWKDYSHKVRANVRRAEREGVHVEIDETGERLDDFISIYYGTMQRCNALEQYYFKEDFFKTIIEKMVGKFIFFHAIHRGKVVSTELVLISHEHLYSFLGGTDATAFGMHPNELIKYNIAVWGVDHGKKTYVLGGGYNGSDGILRYKKEFAPRSIISFKVARRIYDENIYWYLCKKRKQYEVDNAQVWDDNTSYFPLYRAHSIK